MNNFCVKEDQVLKASAAHLYPDFSSVLPSGHSDNPEVTLGSISCIKCSFHKREAVKIVCALLKNSRNLLFEFSISTLGIFCTLQFPH